MKHYTISKDNVNARHICTLGSGHMGTAVLTVYISAVADWKPFVAGHNKGAHMWAPKGNFDWQVDQFQLIVHPGTLVSEWCVSRPFNPGVLGLRPSALFPNLNWSTFKIDRTFLK